MSTRTARVDTPPALPALRAAPAAGPLAWDTRHERPLVGGLSFVVFFLVWEVGAAAGWIDHLFFSSPC